jgi:hypothetical protein
MYNSIVQHNYYLRNKQKILEKAKKYYLLNKGKILNYKEKFYLTHKEDKSKYNMEYQKLNRTKISDQQKGYYQKNRQKIIKRNNQYTKNKRSKDSNFRLRCNLSRRFLLALKGSYKLKTTMKLVGCSLEQLKQHLENQFKLGMTWDNYGKWHVDHIRPCASFDLSKPSEQFKCFHYTNLQPLWAEENLRKNKN